MTAYIAELESQYRPWRYALAFDFNQEMVEAIKLHVPSRQRKWVPELKQWWFKAEARITILDLADLHCGGVRHIENDEVSPAVPGETVAAYKTLHLLPTAPGDLVKAAYRIMSKLHHPDTGGSTREMQRVNEAYRRLTMATRSQRQ